MKTDWRWLPLAACNILLFNLTAMINDALASWNLAVFLVGPCIIWPALRLGNRGLVLCIVTSGLAGDALMPTPAGFLMTLFMLGAGALLLVRRQLGRAGKIRQTVLAWMLNAVYFGIFTVWAVSHNASSLAFWERATVDFCLSQIIVILVSPWFFELQESILRLAGLPVAQEPLGANP